MDRHQIMFEEDRIIQSLKKLNSNEKTLYNDVKSYVGNIPLSDDLTIVMIETL